MRYTNPSTKSLHWQKAWFFLEDDVQHVMVSNISSTTKAPVLSVLDQRRHSGSILVDGSSKQAMTREGARSIWHGNVGYTFSGCDGSAFGLSLEVGQKTGHWAAIGTSTQPPETVDLFAAWIDHRDITKPLSYSVFPGIDADSFYHKSQRSQLQEVNNVDVSGVFDDAHHTAMVVFWDSLGGSVCFTPSGMGMGVLTIVSDGNIALIYNAGTGDVTVSDPSQTLSSVKITLSIDKGMQPQHWPSSRTVTLNFNLPIGPGGFAGSSVSQNIGKGSG